MAGEVGAERDRRPSVSTTRARRWWPGTPTRCGRWPPRSCGRAGAARRSSSGCGRGGVEQRVRELAGTPLDPYFSSTKITWLLENDGRGAGCGSGRPGPLRDARCLRAARAWATVPRTEPSTAARTQLQALAAPGRGTPNCARSSASTPRRCRRSGRRPVISGHLGRAAAACDAGRPDRGAGRPRLHAAGRGQGHLRHRRVRARQRRRPAAGRPRRAAADGGLDAARRPPGAVTYALDGGVFSAGSAIDWLRDPLGLLIDDRRETEAAGALGARHRRRALPAGA